MPPYKSVLDTLPKPWELKTIPVGSDYKFPNPEPPDWYRKYAEQVNEPLGLAQAVKRQAARNQEMEQKEAEKSNLALHPAVPNKGKGRDMMETNVSDSVSTSRHNRLPGGLQSIDRSAKPPRKNVSRDMFEIPESQSEDEPLSRPAQSRMRQDNEGDNMQPRSRTGDLSTSVIIPAPSNQTIQISNDRQRDQASNVRSVQLVSTIHGEREVIPRIPDKQIVELLERGSSARRVWFLCRYEGEDESTTDAVQRVALMKDDDLGDLVKDFEYAEKSRKKARMD